MIQNPSAPLLKIDQLEGSRFKPLDLEITPGSGVIVHSNDQQALDEFIDLVHGLSPRVGGQVLLFDSDPVELTNAARIKLCRELAYACSNSSAGLISNLKVWENIVLPLQACGLATTPAELDQLEELMLEAFAVAGFDESWVRANLHESPDRLTEFQKIICGLVRCHLTGFRLLLGDCLFRGDDSTRVAEADAMLNWLGERHPDSGLLLVHHGRAPVDVLGLSAWKPIEKVSLEAR
ncbi:MAG: hypothetical protein ABJQ29_11835 [Luteolibacter sp.]